jgi:hypothetical protein
MYSSSLISGIFCIYTAPGLFPVMFFAPAMRANYSYTIPIFFEFLSATPLVRVLGYKVEEIH